MKKMKKLNSFIEKIQFERTVYQFNLKNASKSHNITEKLELISEDDKSKTYVYSIKLDYSVVENDTNILSCDITANGIYNIEEYSEEELTEALSVFAKSDLYNEIRSQINTILFSSKLPSSLIPEDIDFASNFYNQKNYD